MRKVGNWYIPDNDHKVVDMVENEEFVCNTALTEAFKYVHKFENAIDVGTWIGDSTKLISEKFKNVVGFEPSPLVFECCVKNLEEFNITNCKIFMKGLSNTAGHQKFLNKGKTLSGWITTLDSVENVNGITVETCRLDDLNLSNIDFIKIDVDSHEGFLVEGAVEFFKNNSPVIMIECKTREHKHRQRDTMPDPLQILEKLGYKIMSRQGKADFILVKEKNI